MEGVRENFISYLIWASSVWSNWVKVGRTETLWCSALQPLCQSLRKLLPSARLMEKGILVVGCCLIRFLQVVFEQHHFYSELHHTIFVLVMIVTYFFFLVGLSTGTSVCVVLTIEELSPADTILQLDPWTEKPEAELPQQCVPLLGPAAWSCWGHKIPQECCRSDVILHEASMCR